MQHRIILTLFLLTLWTSVVEHLPAHSQISGTVFASGDEQQDQNAPRMDPDALADAAEAAMARGDQREAFSLYMSLCLNDEASACLQAAELMVANPELSPEPYAEIALYEMACDRGDIAGCDGIRAVFQDTDAACATNIADACLANAMLRLHNLTEVPYSPTIAATHFSKACDLGHSRACTELGNLYALGIGVEEDQAQTTRLFERACTETNSADCARIADAYLHGRPVAMDVQRAAEYFEQGCDFGDMFSCQTLGYAYLNGTFVDADAGRARRFLKSACDGGAVAVCKDFPVPG